VRTFIAIDLEPGLKDTLLELVDGLKRIRAEVRWVQGQGLHLTLKFLGRTDEDKVAAVQDILDRVAQRHRRFPLVLEGTGTFPPGRAPRVLWAGVRGQPALLALQEDIERELGAEGFPPENRPYHPHLTLGRAKGPEGLREVAAELERRAGAVGGEMEVGRIVLFESLLGPGGARYRIVSEHPLS